MFCKISTSSEKDQAKSRGQLRTKHVRQYESLEKHQTPFVQCATGNTYEICACNTISHPRREERTVSGGGGRPREMHRRENLDGVKDGGQGGQARGVEGPAVLGRLIQGAGAVQIAHRPVGRGVIFPQYVVEIHVEQSRGVALELGEEQVDVELVVWDLRIREGPVEFHLQAVPRGCGRGPHDGRRRLEQILLAVADRLGG